MAKYINLKKIHYVLMLIIFVEMVLGGLGRLFNFPVRITLLFLDIVVLMPLIYKDKFMIPKIYLKWIGVVIGYIAFGGLIGLMNGNSIGSIISDANVFVGIIYLVLMSYTFKEDIGIFKKYTNLIINSAVGVAVLTMGLFFYSGLFLPEDHSIIQTYMDLNARLGYGLITGLVLSGNFARVYLINGIFMQVAIALLIGNYAVKDTNKVSTTLKLVVLLIGVYVSTTRGFWLGTIIVAFLYLMYIIPYHKIRLFLEKNNLYKPKQFALIALVCVALLGAFVVNEINQSSVSDDSSSVVVEGEETYNPVLGTESFTDRLFSIFDFKTNLSNQVRVIQLRFLLEKIEERPLIGWGFGSAIPEYREYIQSQNLQDVSDSSFELYYFELIFKTGIIGLVAIVTYLLRRLYVVYSIFKTGKLDQQTKNMLVSWSIGTASVAVASFTNPYIGSLTGFFIIVVYIYLIESIIINYDKNEEKN